MTIQDSTTAYLLYALQRQYPSHPGTTSAYCANGCGNSARGGGWCAECIGAELMRRGATQGAVASARKRLELRARKIAAAEEAIEALRDQVASPAWLDDALNLADRREHLCRHAAPCPTCGTDQVQLTEYYGSPAAWKCRHCKTTFTHEPQSEARSEDKHDD